MARWVVRLIALQSGAGFGQVQIRHDDVLAVCRAVFGGESGCVVL